MIDYASIGVILLAALIHATLQLSLGSLLLLYHASLGKHIRIKTRRLVTRYISGVGLMILVGVLATCFLIAVLAPEGVLGSGMLMICAGVLVALAFCAWFLYYRSGRSTELWLPKSVAKFIAWRAKVTESNTEAFSLGLLASFAEMPFSLVLTIVAANSILMLREPWLMLMAALIYTAIAVSPLVVLRLGIRSGKTLADAQKWRRQNKTFFRILSGVGFLTLAVFLVAFEVMGR